MARKLLVLTMLVVIAGLVFVGCELEAMPESQPVTQTPGPSTPAVPVTPVSNTIPASPLTAMTGMDTFAGTEKCAMCHTDAMKHWETSWHTKKTNPGPTYGDQFSAKIFPWAKEKWSTLDTHMILDRVDPKDNNRIYVTVQKYDWKEVDWIVGQVRKQRYAIYYDGGPRDAYISTTKDGGISWTIDKSQVYKFEGNKARAGYKFLTLELAPKADSIKTYGEFWSWQERCVTCHTTGFDPVKWDQAKKDFIDGKREDLREIFVADSRIACEACHGAGGEHAKAPSKSNIINPASLKVGDPTRKMVCEQCHTRTSGNIMYPGDSKAPNDSRGFILGKHDYMDVMNYTRPAWGDGNRQVSIDGKGRRDHQMDMDMRLQDHIKGKTGTAHASMACFDCHDAHTIGNDPNKIRTKVSPVETCAKCHFGTAQEYMKILDGATGWGKYGFGAWNNEGGRAATKQHIFNMDSEGRSFGLKPEQYIWAQKKDTVGDKKADFESIWPWERAAYEKKGQKVVVGAKPWEVPAAK
ncbi:hypothetical protein BHU72_12370 [Desulfuribacillus stibiiarsenatis]|uniref:Cytochrome c domain-containing protein n=1 Tax=Desulfuribacillus stibiiarsenatis TaxID=1390249 RepID=A0A1E5L210_9FIRM|nr:multiheme c-type cytochrome [Desulfuribacillus stibiiarsenatis]OEH84192.1 hypothetical protein BHU72_12370 [Desulfuribacillus stibiiarsenatis]